MTTSATDSNPQTSVAAGGYYVDRLVGPSRGNRAKQINANEGRCSVCRKRGKQEKHHLHPAICGQRRKGPVIHVCPLCHFRMHDEIGNEMLRGMKPVKIREILWPNTSADTGPHQ